MKLYYTPGACSLADHIALIEAGLRADLVKVDLKAKTAPDGGDYLQINPKGYVPALQLDDGQVLTENIAILSWIAGRSAGGSLGDMATLRLLETLGFISTEIHKAFKPFFAGAPEADKQAAKLMIQRRLGYLADRMDQGFVLGDRYSVADAYLFVMLRWAAQFDIDVPAVLAAFSRRMTERPAVRRALQDEGLEAAKAA
jgi:glutathione S-transferase